MGLRLGAMVTTWDKDGEQCVRTEDSEEKRKVDPSYLGLMSAGFLFEAMEVF